MTTRPTRIVDAHVHLWDPARTDWYPYLAGQMEIGMGDVKGMARRFDVATYRAEAAGWNVEKLVNVAAATGHHSLDETLEMERTRRGRRHPDALIGGLWPTDTVAEAIAGIDQQMAGEPLPRRPARWARRGPAARRRRAARAAGARPRLRDPRSPRSARGGRRRAGGTRGPGGRRRARRLAAVDRR